MSSTVASCILLVAGLPASTRPLPEHVSLVGAYFALVCMLLRDVVLGDKHIRAGAVRFRKRGKSRNQ